MMLEEGLFAYLTAHGQRVYPQRLPQQPTLPAMTYLMVSDPIEHTHSGPSSLGHPRFQLDCWGSTYLEAKHCARQIMALMSAYVGMMGDVEVNASLPLEARDNEDPETGRHWVSIDVVIWYQR